jgi:hypothetical protein
MEVVKVGNEEDYLNEKLEAKQIGLYLKKTLFAGKTIKAKIVGIEKNTLSDSKDDLLLLIEGDKDIIKMNVSEVDKSGLILLFGPYRKDWIQKEIKIEFSPLKSWVSNGIDKTGSSSRIIKA